MPRQPAPFVAHVDAYEASASNPGAVIRVALSPMGTPRRVTVAEARALVAQLQAAIARAESGEPLPAVPKRTRTTKGT